MQISRLQVILLSLVVAFALIVSYSFSKIYDTALRSEMLSPEVIGYHFDKSSQLSIKNILQQNDLVIPIDATDELSIKNSVTGTHWFSIKPLAFDQGIDDFILQSELPWIDHISFFFITDQQAIISQHIGDDDPFNNRLLPFRKPAVLLANTAGDHRIESIYISVQAQGRISLPLVYVPEKTFNQQANLDHLFYGAIFSILLALAVYNFFIFLSLRDTSYLYYIGYLAAFGFTQFIASGLGQQYLWPNASDLSTLLAHIFLGLTNFSIVFFVSSFLSLKNSLPLFHKLLMSFAWISICCLPLLFVMEYYSLKYLLHGMSFAIMATIFPCSIIMVRRGHREAAFLLASNLVLFPSISVGLLRFLGYFENAFWAEHSAELGIIIEAIILSFGLADRINSLRIDRNKIKRQRLKDQEAFSRRIIQTQEREKRELGKTLHDSLGHQLLLVKRNLESIDNTNPANAAKAIETANKTITATIEDVRNLSHLVYPAILDHLGLKESLAAVLSDSFSQTGIQWTLDFDTVDIPYEKQLLLYRATQECCNNIVKYANASTCTVSVKAAIKHRSSATYKITPSVCHYRITDNGNGIINDEKNPTENTSKSKGFGLTMLREHVHITGGELRIESDSAGTTVLIDL
jgi:signal transduction histidine kinase